MRLLFKSVEAKNVDGWPMGYYGSSYIDNKQYSVDTHYLKADEVPTAMSDAKSCSELIAGLLNAFYKKQDISNLSEEEVRKMGVFTEDRDVAKPDPNQKEIPFK